MEILIPGDVKFICPKVQILDMQVESNFWTKCHLDKYG